MAHVVPGPGGPPPLPPGGFDWTAWNADPGVVTGLAGIGAADPGAAIDRRRVDPRAAGTASASLVRGRPRRALRGADRADSRSLGLLPVQRAHDPAHDAGLRHAAPPPARAARLDGAPAPPAPGSPRARTPAHADRGRLRHVQYRAGGVAPAAPLQPADGAASGAHRRAPHDHGRLGDPLVAAALAPARAAARPVSRADALRVRG